MSRRMWRSHIGWVCFVLSWAALSAVPGHAASRPVAVQSNAGPVAVPDSGPVGGIVITAVSRDDAVLAGGISTGVRTPLGIASIEPIAWLTPAGVWQDLPCNYHWVTDADIAACRAFAVSYLSRFHDYGIVSADGYGAAVESAPARLSDCYSFETNGVYSGQTLERTALAASDPAAFAEGHPLTPVEGAAYQKTLAAFSAASPVHLSTLAGIRLYRVAWGGRNLIVVERSFTDFSSASPSILDSIKLIFAIGAMDQGRFRMLFWKKDTEDDNEQVLGTLVLKGGKEFLVTSVNSSEAQFFRVYEIQKGSVKIVFSGGGSSC